MILSSLFLALLAQAGSSCVPVDGDQILVRHLAAADPAFAGLAPELSIGFAPVPGATRTFRPDQLAALATRLGIHLAKPTGVCFEWDMKAPAKEDLVAAMRDSLGIPEANIELVEVSARPAPPGTIVFPRDGLADPPLSTPGASVLWRGYVRYAGERQYSLWARVKVSVPADRVVALSAIRAGEPIRASQIRVESTTDFPFHTEIVRDAARAIGKIPRRPIPAGAPLVAALLDDAPDVVKGDLVRVEVRSGAARIVMEGRAEASGRQGDHIKVRNMSSGKDFPARVEGAGRVTVTLARRFAGARAEETSNEE